MTSTFCGEQPIGLATAQVAGCFLWPKLQIDVTQSWYQKLHLVARNEQLGLCLPNSLDT